MNEIDGVVAIISNSEKLGVVGVLLLVLFGMGGTLYYVMKSIKEPLEKLSVAMENATQVNEKATEATNKLLGILHEQNTNQLRELESKIDELIICCKQLSARG